MTSPGCGLRWASNRSSTRLARARLARPRSSLALWRWSSPVVVVHPAASTAGDCVGTDRHIEVATLHDSAAVQPRRAGLPRRCGSPRGRSPRPLDRRLRGRRRRRPETRRAPLRARRTGAGPSLPDRATRRPPVRRRAARLWRRIFRGLGRRPANRQQCRRGPGHAPARGLARRAVHRRDVRALRTLRFQQRVRRDRRRWAVPAELPRHRCGHCADRRCRTVDLPPHGARAAVALRLRRRPCGPRRCARSRGRPRRRLR